MATRDREKLQEQFEAEGKTGYVTNEYVTHEIVKDQYHHFSGSTVTVCLLTLRSGFTVVGQSACANPDNFDPELGKTLAYDDARNQVYRFLAFRLLDMKMDDESLPIG